MPLISLLILMLIFMTPTVGYGGSNNIGRNAFDKGNYATAFQEWSISATSGSTTAQLGLANLYANGLGIEKNMGKAAYWYSKAAKLGSSEAQYRVGILYFSGQGLDQNYQMAAESYMQAAEQNHAEAQNNLAGMYALGLGVERDFVKAYMWAYLAATKGAHRSKENLSLFEDRMDEMEIIEAKQLATAWQNSH